MGRIAAIAFAAIIAACSSAPDKADDPAEIADATCREYRPDGNTSCRGLQLPDPASQLAYSMCLEYHPKDAAACNRLRDAYRADLRAYLQSLTTAAGRGPAQADQAPRLDSRQAAALRQTAEELYKAISRDADMFAAALAIAPLRHHVEGVLGRALSDQELRALTDQSRAEAVYWYKYMQGLERAYPGSGREPRSAPPRVSAAQPPG